MNHSYSYYPTLLPKDIEGVTKANSYTEKPYSHFVPTQDEVVHQNVRILHDPRKFVTSQKTLTKVRSMPLKIYNPQNDVFHSKSGQTLEIRNQPFVRETANLTKYIRNSSLKNLSPISNKVNSYDVNQQFSTNIETKSMMSHDMSSIMPKPQNYEKFHIKKSSIQFTPVTFQNTFQNKNKQNLSSILQNRQDKTNQTTLRKSGVYSIPIPNVKFPLQKSQIIHTSFNRNVSPPSNNQLSRPTVVFQNPQYVTFNNQQMRSSKISGFDNKSQFQNVFESQPYTSRISSGNEGFEKISFTKLQQNSQRLNEVELQRPQYRKIRDNKGATAGPQNDYYKEQKSTCSKVLPILGAIFFLLLMAGTLFGLGMMTGLFGDKNYLTKNEGNLIEKDNKSMKIEGENQEIDTFQTSKQKPYAKPQASTGGPQQSQLPEQSKAQKTVTQPSSLPQKSAENKPTFPFPLQPVPIQILPITAPSLPDNQSRNTLVSKEQQYIDAQPISLEQAKQIVDIIIEENHEIVPQNVKFSLRKDILDDVQQVPVNWRDVPHVQKISYQHLQALMNSDPKHKTSMIIYRQHEVQKTKNV